jgi:hypothetical protein
MYVTEYWHPAISRDQRRKEWQKMVEEAIEVQRKKDEKEKKAAEKAAAKAAKAAKAAAVEVSAEKVVAKAATAAKAACGEAAADDSSVRTKRGRGGTKLPAAKKRRGKEKNVGEELEEGKAVVQEVEKEKEEPRVTRPQKQKAAEAAAAVMQLKTAGIVEEQEGALVTRDNNEGDVNEDDNNDGVGDDEDNNDGDDDEDSGGDDPDYVDGDGSNCSDSEDVWVGEEVDTHGIIPLDLLNPVAVLVSVL